MKNIIADLPKGPLDLYRKCATFDWKLLKLNLEGEEFVNFQRDLWDFMEKTPVFRKRACRKLDEERQLCNARVRALRDNSIAVYMTTLIQKKYPDWFC